MTLGLHGFLPSSDYAEGMYDGGFPRNSCVRIADLLKVLNDPVVSEFIDYLKLLRSAAFAEIVRNAIDHCARHGDYTKIVQCLEIAKHTEHYRSCLQYFEENSIASFSIQSGPVKITIDRAKQALGKDLASYLTEQTGSFASTVGEFSRTNEGLNEKRRSHWTKAWMAEEGKRKGAMQEMAVVLEQTPHEYRSAVYRDLSKQQQDKKSEQRESKFRGLKEEIVHLQRQLENATDKDRTEIQEKISALERTAKRTAPKAKRTWSPVLPGSFGSKR